MTRQNILFMLFMLLLLIPIYAQEETTVFDDYEASWGRGLSFAERIEVTSRLIESYHGWAEPYMQRIQFSRVQLFVLYNQNDTEGMKTVWENILNDSQLAQSLLPEPDYVLMYAEGNVHMETGNLEQAEPIFQKMLEHRPYLGNYLYRLYIAQERYDEAKEFFEQLLSTEPYNHTVFDSDKIGYEILNDEDNQQYSQLMDSGLGHAESVDYEEALADYQAAYVFAQESDSVSTFREAFALFHVVDAEMWLNYFEDNNTYSEDAENHIRTVIELAPDWDLPYVELAKLLERDERPDEAITVLDDALMQMPDSPNLYLQRATIHNAIGNDAEANNDYYQYISLSREHLIDWSQFDVVNQTVPLYSENQWHHHYTIQANVGDELSVGFENQVDDSSLHDHHWVLSLIDADGLVIDSEYFMFSSLSVDAPILSITISKSGEYTLIVAATDGFGASWEKLVITLE